jgi:membrane-associated PAP2 superfamily phosphatase
VKRGRATLVTALILAGMLAACAIWPKIDLGLAHRIYEAQGGGFGARRDTALTWLRDLGIHLPIGILGLAFLLWLVGLLRRDPRPALTNRGMLFLAASFALGPGLLVNGVLKDISHRPRPAQLAEFGGQDAFRPWYTFDGACKSNCSFASGEVAGAAWLLAPASLAPPPWRSAAIAAAGAFTLAVAALRMAFGGHFASDVIAAALITLASMLAVAWLLRRAGARNDYCDKRRPSQAPRDAAHTAAYPERPSE